MIGLGHLLAGTELPPLQKRYVDQILSSSEHLLGVLGDILDFSKIESGMLELRPETFSVETVRSDILTAFGPACRTKGLELRVEVGPGVGAHLRGDRLRLTQVLYNLLGNAVRFTALGEIAVTIEVVESPAGRPVRFTVRDTGIGMDASEQARLFQPFTQADASITRRFGGTGLGLSISQKLVGMMGGTICVESARDRGSRFWFDLPLPEAPSPPEARASVAAAATARGKRVLVVEDHPVNQLVIGTLLEKLGAQCTVADNGELALEFCSREVYDLVLMDVQMPVLDGLEATRRLRARGYKAPIIALTAGVTEHERQAVEAAGMDSFLEKPIRSDKLARVLAEWTEGLKSDPGA